MTVSVEQGLLYLSTEWTRQELRSVDGLQGLEWNKLQWIHIIVSLMYSYHGNNTPVWFSLQKVGIDV